MPSDRFSKSSIISLYFPSVGRRTGKLAGEPHPHCEFAAQRCTVPVERGQEALARGATARGLSEPIPRIRHHTDFVEPTVRADAEAQLDHRKIDPRTVGRWRKRAGPREASHHG